MMKPKNYFILLMIIAACTLTACGGSATGQSSQNDSGQLKEFLTKEEIPVPTLEDGIKNVTLMYRDLNVAYQYVLLELNFTQAKKNGEVKFSFFCEECVDYYEDEDEARSPLTQGKIDGDVITISLDKNHLDANGYISFPTKHYKESPLNYEGNLNKSFTVPVNNLSCIQFPTGEVFPNEEWVEANLAAAPTTTYQAEDGTKLKIKLFQPHGSLENVKAFINVTIETPSTTFADLFGDEEYYFETPISKETLQGWNESFFKDGNCFGILNDEYVLPHFDFGVQDIICGPSIKWTPDVVTVIPNPVAPRSPMQFHRIK